MEQSYGFPSNFASKQIIFITHCWRQTLHITCCINFGVRFTKFLANVSLVLSDPIAITCCVNFRANVRNVRNCKSGIK